MKRKLVKTGLSLSLIALGLAAFVYWRSTDNQPPPTNNLEEIRLKNLDGEDVSWDSFRGKAVFLNFWATWCKPCITEMPSIERAYEQLADSGIVFIAASDESPEVIRAFQNFGSYSFNFLQLESGFESMGVYSLPTTIFFDAEGNPVFTEIGAKEWDRPEEIEKLLKERGEVIGGE